MALVTQGARYFALFHAQLLHHAGHAVGGEDPHQGIFHGEVEAGGTRITLTTGTAAQLVVDTDGIRDARYR